MSAPARKLLTPEEYLALERAAETRSAYLDGEVFAMSGASRAHNLLVMNAARLLDSQILERGCETYATDMRVKVSETGLYTYPDVTVVCGPVELEDEHHDTLLNPTLIVEVLSPSTERYDRRDKLAHYQRLASLRECLLVSQDRMRVEQYFRHPDTGVWAHAEYSGPGAEVHLPSIDCRLRLFDLYRRVQLPE